MAHSLITILYIQFIESVFLKKTYSVKTPIHIIHGHCFQIIKKPHLYFLFAFILAITACSSSDEDELKNVNIIRGNNGAWVRLEMVNAETNETTFTLSSAQPAKVNFEVHTPGQQSNIGLELQFSSDMVDFNPSSGLTITDSLGQGSISVLANDNLGLANLSFTLEIGDADLNAEIMAGKIGFEVVPISNNNDSAPSFINFISNSNDSIGLADFPWIDLETDTLVTFQVLSESGIALAGVLVNFAIGGNSEGDDESLSNASMPSNEDGYVTTTLTAGSQSNNVFVEALLNDEEGINAVSDVINITTGTTNQIGSNIEFVSSDPEMIAIAGNNLSLLKTSSTVSFKVIDADGLAVANTTVNFSLSSSVGSATLGESSAISDSAGLVSTRVNAGNVATSIRVIASLDIDNTVAALSTQLAISTGMIDQDSMSLAFSNCKPEALNIVGTQIDATVRAADLLNNPIADGTAFSFTTEGGAIEGSCTTVSGTCSVKWTSQSPYPSDGISSVLVTAIGNESFNDVNSNGVFDNGDSFTDLGEAFRDDNDSASYNSGEFFLDFNNNGSYSSTDNLYNGTPCTHSTLCAVSNYVAVNANSRLLMSGSSANIYIESTLIAGGAKTLISVATSLDISALGNGHNFEVIAEDSNGNSMPGGSTITVETSNATLGSSNSFDVSNCDDFSANRLPVSISPDGDASAGGLTFTVTTPGGTTSSSFLSVID